MTPDPTALDRHREALRRVLAEHPEVTVQEAYRLADEALEAERVRSRPPMGEMRPMYAAAQETPRRHCLDVLFTCLRAFAPGWRP